MTKLSWAELRDFCRTATDGTYLARWTQQESRWDSGSRAGYGDDELDRARQLLADRDLRIETDDVGIVVRAVRR